jgi:general L-amino acid transport system substrate-binding protein
VAAAVLGDATKVNYVVVTDKSRFTAVQTGQADVIFAHTTIKPARESAITVDFLPITFWDGTGAMMKTVDAVGSFDELEGAVLCTTQGSGTEGTIATLLAQKGWTNEVLTYENLEKLFGALSSDRCNVMMTDKSALAAWRGNAPDPAEYTILPDMLGKSPFGGFVAANDSRWRNALRWISYALIEAEERGVTSDNLEEFKASPDLDTKKFLGFEGSYGPDFGLPATFVSDMITQVGNYGEIYERNIGPDTPYAISRPGTLNALHSGGGVLISPLWN